MSTRAVIATRGSRLALWQSEWVADRLREVHPDLEVELRVYKTTGDRFQEASLTAIGGKGAFTKEVQDAVHHGIAIRFSRDGFEWKAEIYELGRSATIKLDRCPTPGAADIVESGCRSTERRDNVWESHVVEQRTVVK